MNPKGRMKSLLAQLEHALREVGDYALYQQSGSITQSQINRYKRQCEMLRGMEKIIIAMGDEWERPV